MLIEGSFLKALVIVAIFQKNSYIQKLGKLLRLENFKSYEVI